MAEEAFLERHLVRAVKAVGGLALKFISPGFDGVPDRLILIAHGKIAFVEVKAEGKNPRPLQWSRINKIRSLGFRVFVLSKKEQIGGIIDEIRST